MDTRRSSRQKTAKPDQNVTENLKGVKRKTQDVDQVNFLLHNPKSALTTMDISVRVYHADSGRYTSQ